jgi:hypothetical protein
MPVARRVLGACRVVSLVFLIVVAALWVRSYWIYDELSYGADRVPRFQWTAYPAAHDFRRWPPAPPPGATHTLLTCFGKVFYREDVYDPAARGGGAVGRAWASDENVLPSFSYSRVETGDMTRPGRWKLRQATLRHWLPAVLFAVLPLTWLERPGTPRPRAHRDRLFWAGASNGACSATSRRAIQRFSSSISPWEYQTLLLTRVRSSQLEQGHGVALVESDYWAICRDLDRQPKLAQCQGRGTSPASARSAWNLDDRAGS